LIRATLRLAALVLWTLAALAFLLAAALVTLANRNVAARLGPALLRAYACGFCALAGIRVARTGALAPAGALVTPNHWGYVDIFVLGSIYRGVFVSRADVAGWPLVGVCARAAGTIFLRRELRKDTVRVGTEIARFLRAPCRVTAFLEGGAGDGTRVRPFKSALVESAVVTGAPCVPVAIRYRLPRDPDADPAVAVAWIEGHLVAHLFGMLRLRRIEADVAFLAPRTGTDRKALAKQLEADVGAALAAR
jgi:1-acyl-sn-glycerol-3-phosphate acyltransferase